MAQRYKIVTSTTIRMRIGTIQPAMCSTYRYAFPLPFSQVQEDNDRVEECGITNDVKMERGDGKPSAPHVFGLATEGENIIEEE